MQERAQYRATLAGFKFILSFPGAFRLQKTSGWKCGFNKSKFHTCNFRCRCNRGYICLFKLCELCRRSLKRERCHMNQNRAWLRTSIWKSSTFNGSFSSVYIRTNYVFTMFTQLKLVVAEEIKTRAVKIIAPICAQVFMQNIPFWRLSLTSDVVIVGMSSTHSPSAVQSRLTHLTLRR